MEKEQMRDLAEKIVCDLNPDLPPKTQIVVLISDENGKWVGTAGNVEFERIGSLLWSALAPLGGTEKCFFAPNERL